MAAKRKVVKETSVKKPATTKRSGMRLNSEMKKNESSDKSNYLSRKNPNFKYVVLGVFLILLLAVVMLSKGLFIAATVDGKPISRLKLIQTLEKDSGRQALDNLVTKELILNEARQKNIVVSLEDIQPQLDEVNKQLEAEGTTLDAALSVRGLTKESFQENLRMQSIVEKMLEDETAVSDEELLKYFEENKEFYGEEVKYEDLKEDLRMQLKQSKLEEEYQNLYEKLKSESDIKYFVNF